MAQKYIVDDIVMYKNKIHTTIDTLGQNNYELSYVRHSVNQAELSGVPLTPEILEKNGWKASLEGTWIYEKEDSVKIFRLLDDTHYAACIGFVRLLEFQYIHQLQHLLFGLGMNSEMEV